LGIPLVVALICRASFSSAVAVPKTQLADDPTRVVVRGRVVCLNEAGSRFTSGPNCSQRPQRFGFVAGDGKFYLFMPTDSATGMFVDPRVRRQELQVTARLHPNNQLEIIAVRSVRDDGLYEIFYFCEVCNITAYAPGPCECCRDEMEFKERHVREP
jgi:hypothetical protein